LRSGGHRFSSEVHGVPSKFNGAFKKFVIVNYAFEVPQTSAENFHTQATERDGEFQKGGISNISAEFH
jgi:hypothetical protein